MIFDGFDKKAFLQSSFFMLEMFKKQFLLFFIAVRFHLTDT